MYEILGLKQETVWSHLNTLYRAAICNGTGTYYLRIPKNAQEVKIPYFRFEALVNARKTQDAMNNNS